MNRTRIRPAPSSARGVVGAPSIAAFGGFVPPSWAEISQLLRASLILWCVLLVVAVLRTIVNAFIYSRRFRAMVGRGKNRTPKERALAKVARFWRTCVQLIMRSQVSEAQLAIYLGLPRFIGGTVVCTLYIVETYMQSIPTHFYFFQLTYGLAVLGILLMKFVYSERPIFFVLNLTTVVECLSIPSLILSGGGQWLNFNFLQAYCILVEWSMLEKHDIVLSNYSTLNRLLVNLVVQMITFVYITSCGVQLFELLGDPGSRLGQETFQITWANSVYFAVVTLMTVGYGDFVPYTLFGRMWIVLHIIGAAFLVTREISLLIDALKSMRRGGGSYVKASGTQHIVITGHIKWDFLVQFVKEFLAERDNLDTKVIVLASNPEWTDDDWNRFVWHDPFYDYHLIYLEGSALKSEDLGRSQVEKASAVFVFADPHRNDPYRADSDTLKALLTIRNCARDVPIFTLNALHDSSFQFTIAMEQVDERDTDWFLNDRSVLAKSRTFATLSSFLPNARLPSDSIFGSSADIVADYGLGTGNSSTGFAPAHRSELEALPRSLSSASNVFAQNNVIGGVGTLGDLYSREEDLPQSIAGTAAPALAREKNARRLSDSVCMQKLEMAMLAESIFCNGLSTLITNLSLRVHTESRPNDKPWLLEYKLGSECGIRFTSMPASLSGRRLGDVALYLYDYGMVMLAVRKSQNHNWTLMNVNLILNSPMIVAVLTYHEGSVMEKMIEHAARFIAARDTLAAVDGRKDEFGIGLSSSGQNSAVAGVTHSLEMDNIDDFAYVHSPERAAPPGDTSRVTYSSAHLRSPAGPSRGDGRFPSERPGVSARAETPPGRSDSKSDNTASAQRTSGAAALERNSPLTPASSAVSAAVPSTASSSGAAKENDIRPNLAPGSKSGGHRARDPEQGGGDKKAGPAGRPLTELTRPARAHARRSSGSAYPSPASGAASAGPAGPSRVPGREIASGRTPPGAGPSERRATPEVPGSTAPAGQGMRIGSRGEHVNRGQMPQIFSSRDALPAKLAGHVIVCLGGEYPLINLDYLLQRIWIERSWEKNLAPVVVVHPSFPKHFEREVSGYKRDLFLLRGNPLSLDTLRQAQFETSRAILIMSSESMPGESSKGSTDSQAIFTIMTLDALLNERSTTFVCCMLDSEDSLQLLLSPAHPRRCLMNLGEHEEASVLYRQQGGGIGRSSSFRSSPSQIQIISRTQSATDMPRTMSGYMYPSVFHGSQTGILSAHYGAIATSQQSMPVTGLLGQGSSSALQPKLPRTTSLATGLKKSSTFWKRWTSTRLDHSESSDDEHDGKHLHGSSMHHLLSSHDAQVSSRDELIERMRFASGEMMISSLFAGMLVREYVNSGFLNLVREMIGTGSDPQRSWIRQIDVPSVWTESATALDGRSYRETVEHLLTLGCIPLGLYRSGTAPVRIATDEPTPGGEEEDLSFHDGLDCDPSVSHDLNRRTAGLLGHSQSLERRGSSGILVSLSSALLRMRSGMEREGSERDLAADHVAGGRGRASGGHDGNGAAPDRVLDDSAATPLLAGHRDSSGNDGHSGGNGGGIGMSGEDFEDYLHYSCPTTKRRILYQEAECGENVLPYVYTNPEPYTAVVSSDAVFVLCHPDTELPQDWGLS